MKLRTSPLLLLGFALLFVPSASAKCTTNVDLVCEAAETAQFEKLFGIYGDLVLIFVGLFAAAGAIVFLLWIVFHVKVMRLLKLKAGEKLREVEPGGRARAKFEIENLQSRLPVDVFLEKGDLPAGWSQEVKASVVLPSGFRMPQELTDSSSITLGPASKGANHVVVEFTATAPEELSAEESIDYELRVVPVFRGKLRKGKSKKARLTFLVTPHLPKVQIARVSHQPEHIKVGMPVLTKATLVNRGDRPASEVAVVFAINGTEVDKKIVPAMPVESEMDVEFNWTPQSGENRIRVAIGS